MNTKASGGRFCRKERVSALPACGDARSLLHHRRDLQVHDIRGNIDTRLLKLEGDDFDAIVLAAAGLERLQLNAHGEYSPLFALEGHNFIAAPGQGALAIEVRRGDDIVLEVMSALEHASTRIEIGAERAVMRALNAGCSTPLGARAVVDETTATVSLHAVVLTPNGDERFFASARGVLTAPDELGEGVAAQLLKGGATVMLSTQS
jgi:hydroxymethylbilane synthase